MILVTGASGFLGQHLVRKLSAQGKVVRALYHQSTPTASLLSLPGVVWHQADLLDVYDVEEAFDGVDYVFHCAAMVSFDPAQKAALLHFNVASTANIVDAALNGGVTKLVAVSSIASLGRASKVSTMITEAADWEESTQNSAYSISKYYAEMEVWRGIGEGLDAVIVNPGIILGEGNWDKGSAKLIKVVADEFPYYTAGVNAWVDVQDVAEVLVLLMDEPITAERYIVSAGNFSYREVFSKMASDLGKKPPSIKVSPFLSKVVASWSLLKSRLAGTEPIITPESARTAQTKCYYDNSKLLAALPAFQYTPLDVTIQRMAAAYLRENKS